jgi:hypothetical protein
MAIDDNVEWDPATFPENRRLIEELDQTIEHKAQLEARRQALLARVVAAVRTAIPEIEGLVMARKGKYAREEELRGGIADALRKQGELVLTEAKLPVPGWTPNLGGFDFALVGAAGGLTLGETKWADGNLYECAWDILKLASASKLPRIEAAVAVYGAPVKHWTKPVIGADLFEDRVMTFRDVIKASQARWQTNLAGSRARPLALPLVIELGLLATEQVEILGKAWEVRILAVHGDGVLRELEGRESAASPSAAPPSP